MASSGDYYVYDRLWLISLFFSIWAATWQNQQGECAPSEDTDQPGHPPSLIRVFAVRLLAFFMRTAKTLIRLGGCPGWSESSLGAHAILLVLSRCGSYLFDQEQIQSHSTSCQRHKTRKDHKISRNKVKQQMRKTKRTTLSQQMAARLF